MTTARDIISEAMRDAGVLGVGQTLLDEDYNSALIRLNGMLSQWTVKRYLVYHLLDKSVVSTGAQYYTIGPAANIDVPVRPDKLEGAYLRLLASPNPPVDYPLRLLFSMQDYSRIAVKQLGTFPSDLFYDNDFPTGKLYPWPVPQANLYEIHVLIKDRLTEFPSLDTVFAFPPEYLPALQYALAVRCRAAYRLKRDEGLEALAKDALDTLRAANPQVPTLVMPDNLIRAGRYNIYSDRIR